MANALHEVWAELVAQAWRDSAFKHELVSNPSQRLAEHGITIPQGLKCEVIEGGKLIERKGDVLRLPLPEMREGEQSDEELEAVAGGVATLRTYFVRSFSTSDYSMSFTVSGIPQ